MSTDSASMDIEDSTLVL